MNNQPFTLIDVQVGMERLSLHTSMAPSSFTFFWGLVMASNKMKPRFKNPFNITVAQAIGAGGGECRQTVNKRQKQLNSVRIDGEPLITITPGSRKDNTAAIYQINYDLIVPMDHVLLETEERTSPGSSPNGDDHGSFLRSDQRRVRSPQPPQIGLSIVNGPEKVEKVKSGGGDEAPLSQEISRELIERYSKVYKKGEMVMLLEKFRMVKMNYGDTVDLLDRFAPKSMWRYVKEVEQKMAGGLKPRYPDRFMFTSIEKGMKIQSNES